MPSGTSPPAEPAGFPDGAAVTRRRHVAAAGHSGELAVVDEARHDPDAGVRAVALGALRRQGRLSPSVLLAALGDPAGAVRRRACEEAAALAGAAAGPDGGVIGAVLGCLDDGDPAVVEAACFALGELLGDSGAPGAVDALSAVVTGHPEALCREAAVAALGAIGDPAALPAILTATTDRPAVRRRAVLALAPFDGPDVAAALARARTDRDWQVRQAAEDLSGE